MAHIKNRLRGLLVAFVALVAALAIVPTAALALSNESTGDITISGFEVGDTVTLYKVVDTTYSDPELDGNNTIEHAWNSSVAEYMSMTIDDYLATDNDAEGKGTTAEAVGAAVNAAIAAGTAQGISTTNTNGTVTANGLKMGQYYVLVAPAEGSQRTYQHMIISVQPTAKSDGTWAEPVQLSEVPQPKYTEETTVTKDITGKEPATGYLPGTEVEFTIETSIPSYAPNTNWDETTFTITDTRTNIVAPADSAYVVTVGTETVAAGDGTYTVSTVGNVTTFTFDSEFVKSHQNQTVTIVYTAEVAGELDHTKPIENQVLVDPDNETTPGSDTVTLELYKVTGKKVDSETKKGLEGAVFSIYRDSNKNGTYDAGADALIAEGIKSNDQGVFEYDPLAEGTYFLVETQAPAGYQPLTGEVSFSTGDADDENVITIGDVLNTKDDTIELPTTGGAGTVALTAAGVVLVAGAAAFIVRSRKEN